VLGQCSKALSANEAHASVDGGEGSWVGAIGHIHLQHSATVRLLHNTLFLFEWGPLSDQAHVFVEGGGGCRVRAIGHIHLQRVTTTAEFTWALTRPLPLFMVGKGTGHGPFGTVCLLHLVQIAALSAVRPMPL
jgi:hypothetical protein